MSLMAMLGTPACLPRGCCHPHIHCVVPAGGLTSDHSGWIHSHSKFFLPKAVLMAVFRGKFTDALEEAFAQGKLVFCGRIKPLSQPKVFRALLRQVHRHDWVVHVKPPFGGPEHVLRYLGGYTHRVAISNHRIVAFQDGQVSFRWRDRAHHNKKRLLTLSAEEFLRRFLLHLLPPGFVRIRHFGFLANRRRARLLPLCFTLLGMAEVPAENQTIAANAPDPEFWACPLCGGAMVIIERLAPAPACIRPPPPSRQEGA